MSYSKASIDASEQDVLDVLKSLDTTKATGPDGIGPRLLYEVGYTIVQSAGRPLIF